jgi:hypothetical protein
MRETRSSGSVEGVVRDHDLYSDSFILAGRGRRCMPLANEPGNFELVQVE